MKKVFARATYKRYLPEMMIYIAVWLIVLMVPVVSNFFELLSGKMERSFYFMAQCVAILFPFLIE